MKLSFISPALKLMFAFFLLVIIGCKFRDSLSVQSSLMNEIGRNTIDIPAELAPSQVFNHIDYIGSKNDDPQYLFKYNLGKIIFLKNGRNITTAHSQAFSTYIEKIEMEAVIKKAVDNNVLDKFGRELFTTLYQNVEDVNDLKTKYPEIKDREDYDLLITIINSYKAQLSDEILSNKTLSQNPNCADCLMKCVNSYTFSSEWWHNYHKGYELCSISDNKNVCNFYAFYFAEANGLTKCEVKVCNTSCALQEQEMAFLYD